MPVAKPAVPFLNVDHPFALTAVAILALTEGTGQPAIIQGPHGDGTPVTAPTATWWDGATPGTWITNSAGAGLRWVSSTSPLRPGTDSGSSAAWVPNGDMTLLVARSRAGAFGDNLRFWRVPNSGQFDIYLPENDSKVYLDYGGQSSPNRLVSGVLTYTIDQVDYWAFTAGAAGSAIWQNGVKRTSQATGITKSASSANPYISTPSGGMDVNFVQINDSQWDDTLIGEWFADPYAHLYEASASIVSTTSIHRAGPSGLASYGPSGA